MDPHLLITQFCVPQFPVPARELTRGTMVRAIRPLDKVGANVPVGYMGVVFEEANAYSDGYGPMVRWTHGGACNVNDGDFEVIHKW